MSYFCLHQPVVSLYHWISISLVSYLNKNLQRRRQHTTYKNNTTSTTTRFRIKINTLLRAGISAQEKVGYEQNIFVPFLSSPSCIILPPSLTRDFRWVTAPISGFSVIYWCSGTKFGIFVVVVVVVAAVACFCCCCRCFVVVFVLDRRWRTTATYVRDQLSTFSFPFPIVLYQNLLSEKPDDAQFLKGIFPIS